MEKSMDSVLETDILRLQGIYYNMPDDRRILYASLFDNFYLLFSNLTTLPDDLVTTTSDRLSQLWEKIYDVNLLPGVEREAAIQEMIKDPEASLVTA